MIAEPGFLEQSVTFLNRHDGLWGVVCHSNHIEEVISAGSVLECGRRPFNAWLNVQIAEMAAEMFFRQYPFFPSPCGERPAVLTRPCRYSGIGISIFVL